MNKTGKLLRQGLPVFAHSKEPSLLAGLLHLALGSQGSAATMKVNMDSAKTTNNSSTI